MNNENERFEGFFSRVVEQVRTLVLVPICQENKSENASPVCSVSSRVQEVLGLAQAIRLEVVYYETVNINIPRPATLFGTGKVKALTHYISEYDIELVIVDHFFDTSTAA